MPNHVLKGHGCPTCARVNSSLHWDKDENLKEQALLVKDYIYVMQSDTCIKVGVSVNPEKRLREVKRDSADQSWQIVHLLETNTWDAYILESKIHSKYNRFFSTHKWSGHTELHYIEDLPAIINSLDIVS